VSNVLLSTLVYACAVKYLCSNSAPVYIPALSWPPGLFVYTVHGIFSSMILRGSASTVKRPKGICTNDKAHPKTDEDRLSHSVGMIKDECENF